MKMRKRKKKENKFFAHLPLAEESKKAIVQPYSNFTNFPQPYKGPRKRENLKNCSFFFSNCMEGKEKDRGAYMLLRHSSTMFRWIIIYTVFERTCSKDGGIKHRDDDQQESGPKFSVGSWNSEFPTITLCQIQVLGHMKTPHHLIAPENIISTVLGNIRFGSRKCGQC